MRNHVRATLLAPWLAPALVVAAILALLAVHVVGVGR